MTTAPRSKKVTIPIPSFSEPTDLIVAGVTCMICGKQGTYIREPDLSCSPPPPCEHAVIPAGWRRNRGGER